MGIQLRPIFDVTDKSGGVMTDVLMRKVNSEVDLRIGDLVNVWWFSDDNLRGALLGSWAAVMFARHPGAEQVVVRVEACLLRGGAGDRAIRLLAGAR